MAMSFAFLMVVFAALCLMALAIGVLVIMFRAVTRANSQGPVAGSGSGLNAGVPPVLGDSHLADPAHPLHPFHHASPGMDAATRHFSTDAGSSAPSMDSGSAGSSSSGPDGGAGCG